MNQSRCVWLGAMLLASCLGCASLRQEDPMADYAMSSMPGELEPDQGMFTTATDRMVNSLKASWGMGPDEGAARQQFQAAQDLYESAGKTEGIAQQKQYEGAAAAFAKAAARWPNSSIAEDALFFQAESYFFADRYPKARDQFAALAKQYQSTKYMDNISRRRFQIAEYWLEHHKQSPGLAIQPNFLARDRPTFDAFGHAIKILDDIRMDDPTGELADDATMLAAESSFRAGKFMEADELLEDLRRSFPNSRHQYMAHRLGLETKQKLYQGSSYDSGPLDDAKQLITQMNRQFPQEAEKDRDLLRQAHKDVRMNYAVRAMELAKYRDRRGEYRAARVQYQRVAREFSDTSLAAEAKERLEALGEMPDMPPQRMEWLAKAFPEAEDPHPLLQKGNLRR